MRLAATHALEQLYSEAARRALLEGFTHRFCARVVEMSHDLDDRVAAQAIRVATCFLHYKDTNGRLEVLKEADVQMLAGLVNATSREISQAAGGFFYEHFLKETPTLSQGMSQGNETRPWCMHRGSVSEALRAGCRTRRGEGR